MVPDNYLVHLCCHTLPDNTIPELSTEGNNYIKTYIPDNCNKKKGNRPWRPIGLQDVEAPTFCLDNRLTHGGKVVSPTRQPPFIPQEDSWYSFLLEAELTQGHSAARRTRSIEKIHLIGTRSRNLLACSTVPQPTTLPRATTANTDDDPTVITYTSYSIYSNERLLQWCEMNGPLLDHIEVVGFLDGPHCIQNQWCSSSQTATSFLPLSHNCTKNSTNYMNLVNCNSMKRGSH
jgi:hypothetical protein